jgi:hypothetical protein
VFFDPSDSYFLFADLVGFYTHWTYMHIILSNYWWQKSDIWSQASCRYPISWEVFLDPSDSYFLFADFVDFYTHWTYMLIFCRIFLNNYWCQVPHIVGSVFVPVRFLLPVCRLSWFLCTFFITFFSATIDGRNLIFRHKLHIGTPYVFGPLRFLLPVCRRVGVS